VVPVVLSDGWVLPFDELIDYSAFVVRVPERERVRAHLAGRGIETAVYYPRSLAAQPALAAWSRPTPRADAFCGDCLALPVHEGLTDVDVERDIFLGTAGLSRETKRHGYNADKQYSPFASALEFGHGALFLRRNVEYAHDVKPARFYPAELGDVVSRFLGQCAPTAATREYAER
jgi:hypothetical protein